MNKISILGCALLLFFGVCGQAKKQSRSKKAQEVEKFASDAASFLQKQKTHAAIAAFKNDIRWRKTHVELIVIDDNDIVWFATREYPLVWTRFGDIRTIQGEPLIEKMKDVGIEGGWVAFLWNQDLVHAHVKTITKGRAKFVLGAIVFEQSVSLNAQELVFRAQNYFQRNGLEQTVEQINNPAGQFVYGSISVEMYDNNGICIADSFDNTNVGRKVSQIKDDKGKSLLTDYMRATEERPEHAWVEHIVNGLKQRSFVLRIRPADISKFYIFVSTYFPQVNDKFVVQKVNEAVEYIKKNGATKAFSDFSRNQKAFFTARLAVVVYDEKGTVKAHSKFPSLAGVNAYNRLDQGGYPITQKILNKVLGKGKGWVFQYLANAAELIYGEKVTTPEGTFAVTVQGYTPISPKIISASLAERISRTFLTKPAPVVLNQISFNGSLWSRGYQDVQEGVSIADLFMRVYDKNGYCLTAGIFHDAIWKKIDDGFLMAIKKLDTNKSTGGWVSDAVGDVGRHYYVKKCVKGPEEKYIIFVGYKTYKT